MRGRGLRVAAVVAAVLGAVAALASLVLGPISKQGVVRAEAVATASPAADLHLPRTVNTPGVWSDEKGPAGPLAAVGLAVRARTEGLTGERQQLEMFGVSAVDGRSVWIELPGADVAEYPLVDWFALSPDGRWLGWARGRDPGRPGGAARLLGWAVMETSTGRVRVLEDRAAPGLRTTASELAFSADSRYLLTSYEWSDAPRTRGHRFVAWDVDDGTPTVLEDPGHYWLPNLGSAPTDVVWARGQRVYRSDPATGARLSYVLPRSVVTASWAPDDTGFAYIGQPPGDSRDPWRLYAGPTVQTARALRLPPEIHPSQLLGWRDDTHVVVGHYRSSVHVVDVRSGDVQEVDLAGYGNPMNPPLLAAGLWGNPLATPKEPTGTRDPRAPYRWATGGLLVLLAGGWLVRRRIRA